MAGLSDIFNVHDRARHALATQPTIALQALGQTTLDRTFRLEGEVDDLHRAGAGGRVSRIATCSWVALTLDGARTPLVSQGGE
jgi:hypothetical protein